MKMLPSGVESRPPQNRQEAIGRMHLADAASLWYAIRASAAR
jgi:hypothetical protein